MKKFIIALLVALVITACSSGSFVDSLEKQYSSIEGYTAEYTVIMNDVKFTVVEEYKDKGEFHSIKISSKGYQQEIELKGDKVSLKNSNHNEVIQGKRENFNLPAYVLIQVMEEIVKNKDTLKVVSENQIEVNNGEYVITHENKKIAKVEITLGGNEILVEYTNIDIK